MGQYTVDQISKITTQGIQKFIVIQKKYHEALAEKKLLGKDLKIRIIFKDDD